MDPKRTLAVLREVSSGLHEPIEWTGLGALSSKQAKYVSGLLREAHRDLIELQQEIVAESRAAARRPK